MEQNAFGGRAVPCRPVKSVESLNPYCEILRTPLTVPNLISIRSRVLILYRVEIWPFLEERVAVNTGPELPNYGSACNSVHHHHHHHHQNL